MNKKNQAQRSTKDIAASLALVTKANAPFASAVRLTAVQKSRAAKMKRGAAQVIPTIAHVATKFAVEAPGMPIADMQSAIDYARSLEPLLGAVSAFYETLRDEYLLANASAWTTATVTYGMLRKATRANQNLANELAPVQKWFRQVSRGTKPASDTSAPAPTHATSPSTNVVPATKPSVVGNGASVAGASISPAGPVGGASSNGAAAAN